MTEVPFAPISADEVDDVEGEQRRLTPETIAARRRVAAREDQRRDDARLTAKLADSERMRLKCHELLCERLRVLGEPVPTWTPLANGTLQMQVPWSEERRRACADKLTSLGG